MEGAVPFLLLLINRVHNQTLVALQGLGAVSSTTIFMCILLPFLFGLFCGHHVSPITPGGGGYHPFAPTAVIYEVFHMFVYPLVFQCNHNIRISECYPPNQHLEQRLTKLSHGNSRVKAFP